MMAGKAEHETLRHIHNDVTNVNLKSLNMAGMGMLSQLGSYLYRKLQNLPSAESANVKNHHSFQV
jgi:hypothetical protein